jgi:hypothetical protein
MGAGKDTIATHLQDRHGYAVIRFSTPLKAEVKVRLRRTLSALATLNGLRSGPGESQSDFLEWVLTVAKPHGVRELLQEYGTEVRRQDDPAYWINAWDREYTKHRARNSHIPVVVPDVRFANEARTIERAGGVVIRVERANLGTLDLASHASELGLRRYDYIKVFHNNGTVTDLQVQIDQWLTARA